MFSIKEKFNNLIILAREKTEKYVYSCFLPLLIALIALLFWVANLQLIGFAIVVLMACFVLIVYDDFLPIVCFLLMIPMCFRNPEEAIASSLVLTIIIFALLVLAIVYHFIKYPIKITLNSYFYILLGVGAVFVFGGLFTGDINNYFKAIDLFAIATVVPIGIHLLFYSNVKLNQKVDYRKYFCLIFIIATNLACVQLCCAFVHNQTIGPWPYGRMPGGFCWANSNHIASMILLAVPLCCYMMASAKKLLLWFVELGFLYLTIALSGSDGGLITLFIFTPFLMYALYQNIYKNNRKTLFNFYYLLISCGILFVAYLLLFRFDNFFAYVLDSSSGNGRIYPYTVALENFVKSPIFGVGFGNGRASLDAIIHIHETNGFFHSTALHMMACAGVIGVAVYVLYYVIRVKHLAKNNTLLGYFSLFALFMFGVYGMIENNEFNIVLMFMSIIITIVSLMNEKGSDDKPLPLYVKVPKF